MQSPQIAEGNLVQRVEATGDHEASSRPGQESAKGDQATLKNEGGSLHEPQSFAEVVDATRNELGEANDVGDIDESLDCEEAQSEIIMPQKLRALCEKNKTLYETSSRSRVNGGGLAEGSVNAGPAVLTPHRSMPGLRGPTPSNCSREGSSSFQESRPFAQRPVLQQGPLKDLISWLKDADVDDMLEPSCVDEITQAPANVEIVGRKVPPAGLTQTGGNRNVDVRPKTEELGMLWDGDVDGDVEEVPSDREGGLPTAPPLASHATPSMRPMTPEPIPVRDGPMPGYCSLPSNVPTEPNEEEEWLARQRLTGAIGRLVRYTEGDLSPKDDILGLRSTKRGRIMVTAVRDSGIAMKAGVAAGDELVSIDGRKEFSGHPPHVVHASLRAPTTLVFCGFVGKLQAEVRVKRPPEPKCGFALGAEVVAPTPESSALNNLQFCDAVVFQRGESSLLLATNDSTDTSHQLYDDEQDIDSPLLQQRESKSTIVYEIQREDARNLVLNSLVPESEFSTMATL